MQILQPLHLEKTVHPARMNEAESASKTQSIDTPLARHDRLETATLFVIAILGFSFWFFMAVPFASHRESYTWMASVYSQSFKEAFSFISVTYRPFAQGTTWFGFMLLDPRIFPTSVLRQTLLQGFIYICFVAAWWLIFSAVHEKRLFALIACVIGAVCFPSYVHLFHIYGLFYVPVMLMLGWVLRLKAFPNGLAREGRVAVLALLLVCWHPFATALFLGFYFGYYLDTFAQRKRIEHLRALAILASCFFAIVIFVIIFPRSDVAVPFQTKLYGFLVSYQTNEINSAASFVALMLTELAVFSIRMPIRIKWVCATVLALVGCAFAFYRIPVLLLWFGVVLFKLVRMKNWSLFFLAVTAIVFPIGAVIGTPVFGLFAIIVAGVSTCLDWREAESRLTILRPGIAMAIVATAALTVVAIRAGAHVPGVSAAARPLLGERERTYQLETMLAWLHQSEYCSYEIAFSDKGGSPIDSVENVITRKYRPPSDIADVTPFWKTVLQCKGGAASPGGGNVAILSFGGYSVAGSTAVYTIPGKYGGDAAVWVRRPDAENGLTSRGVH